MTINIILTEKSSSLSSLYPGDLYPFTRKPLFLIVDSDNSFVFQNLPPYFGQPLIILMSPQDLPSIFHGKRSSQKGILREGGQSPAMSEYF